MKHNCCGKLYCKVCPAGQAARECNRKLHFVIVVRHRSLHEGGCVTNRHSCLSLQSQVIHFLHCEVKSIHVGRCKVSVGLKRKCSSQADSCKRIKMNVVINKTFFLFQQSSRQTLRLQVRLRLEAGHRILGQGVEHPGHRGRAKVLWQHHNLQMKTSMCVVALCGDLTDWTDKLLPGTVYMCDFDHAMSHSVAIR